MTVKVNVRFPNLATLGREEVAYTTVPFAQGEWNGQVPLVLLDEASQPCEMFIEPMGARYPDGSVRYARMLSRVKLDTGQTRSLLLTEGKDSDASVSTFAFHPAIAIGSVGGGMFCKIKVGGTWTEANFATNLIAIEDNRMRKVLRSRHRVGNFVVDLKLYIMSRQQVMKYELSITGSNPSNTLYTYPFDEIRIGMNGNNLINVRGAARRGVQPVTLYKDYRVMAQDYIGDGQKQSWYGEIIPALDASQPEQVSNAIAAIQYPLYGMSTDWGTKMAYAAFGVTQKPTKNDIGSYWTQLINLYNSYSSFVNSPGTPWDDYLSGLTKTPGQTGDQDDFGCLEGGGILHLGAAELLDMVYFMATEETKRPGHYYELNANEVTSANHPNWVVWDGRTHWHTGVSPDRLGKTAPDLGGYFHGWFGKDWEHHSSNLLTLAALMTGSYLLLDEVNREVELYLGGHTLPSMKPGWSTNGRFAPRAFGRTHHAMSNHFLLTNRQDLMTRMLARFRECVLPAWDGATRSPVRNWEHIKDDRVLAGAVDAWVPWNDSLGFVGAVALYNVSRATDVLEMLRAWGSTILNYGWRPEFNPDGTLRYVGIGQGVQWFADGHPLAPQDYFNGISFIDAGGLSLWGLPVLKVISENPQVFNAADVERAKEYLRVQRLARQNTVPFDEWGQWEAIKLQ